ncbi:MAG: mechanosensitive ion channel domain-containing protein [Gemmatimonadales bacterium]
MTCSTRLLLALALLVGLANGAAAQRPRVLRPSPAAPDTIVAPPALPVDTSLSPFAPTDVPTAADRSIARAFELSTAGVSEQPGDILEGVAALSDSIAREDRVAVLSRDRLLTRRGLGDLALNWTARDREVRAWRRQLQEVSAQVDSARRELAGLRERWRVTAASQDSTTLPDLRARTTQVIDELRLVDSALDARTTRVVDAELTLSEASSTIFAELHGLAAAQQEMRRNLLRIESPPLWKSVVATGSLSTSERGGLGTAVHELEWFVRGNAGRLTLHVLLTLVVVLLAMTKRERVRSAADSSDALGEQFTILRRPVASILLLSISLTMWFYPRAPLGVYDAALVLSAIPLLLLVPELIPPDLHRSAREAIVFLVLQRLAALATLGSAASRLTQLGLSVAGALLLWQLLRPGGALRQSEPRWRFTLQRAAWVLLSAFIVALGSNVIGNVTLADAINSGVALSAFAAILLRAITMVINIFISAAVHAGASESRYLTERGAQVERTLVRLTGTLGFIAWFALSLQGLQLWVPVWNALRAALFRSFTIGAVSLSLAIALLFVFVLALGVLGARLISGIVEFEVMGRMDLRRGVSVTVGSLLRYALIAIAFLVALAAVGINAGNLAILGGALGVGIGFGLQNIVNNFISGLLLAFERPVGIGDTVQVGPNTGEVREIGIRASIIRTVEGAEVIVPNSELITQDVINWTRSGTRRRIDIPIGVAYGNDPAKVIDLLTDVALQHADVRGNPKPFTLFLGFGDNSLDFSVRAWTDSPDWPVVRSDIAVAISAVLRDAGIEIPFPQRDLHLRSVDVELLKDLRGEATGA